MTEEQTQTQKVQSTESAQQAPSVSPVEEKKPQESINKPRLKPSPLVLVLILFVIGVAVYMLYTKGMFGENEMTPSSQQSEEVEPIPTLATTDNTESIIEDFEATQIEDGSEDFNEVQTELNGL